jgi:hypothetical protein
VIKGGLLSAADDSRWRLAPLAIDCPVPRDGTSSPAGEGP